MLASVLALAMMLQSQAPVKECNIRVHVLDVKTGRGIQDVDAFAYSPSDSKLEQKVKTDAKGDACLSFSAAFKDSFYVGTYASRYRSVATYSKFQSLPQDVTIRLKRINRFRDYGTRALGH